MLSWMWGTRNIRHCPVTGPGEKDLEYRARPVLTLAKEAGHLGLPPDPLPVAAAWPALQREREGPGLGRRLPAPGCRVPLTTACLQLHLESCSVCLPPWGSYLTAPHPTPAIQRRLRGAETQPSVQDFTWSKQVLPWPRALWTPMVPRALPRPSPGPITACPGFLLPTQAHLPPSTPVGSAPGPPCLLCS